MDAEEIKELIRDYIKDSLSIEIRRSYDYGFGGDTDVRLEVKLFLGSDQISSDYITL
jgi:hypothetical protein